MTWNLIYTWSVSSGKEDIFASYLLHVSLFPVPLAQCCSHLFVVVVVVDSWVLMPSSWSSHLVETLISKFSFDLCRGPGRDVGWTEVIALLLATLLMLVIQQWGSCNPLGSGCQQAQNRV